MKTALIVVDVQKFFLHDAPDDLADNIAKHINDNAYSVITFTVFKNKPESNFVRSLGWNKCNGKEDTTLPGAFSRYIGNDNVFTRATYSGFSSTALNDYLTSNQIKTVVICGVDTDACVLATAFSAFDNGYVVNVNFDLTFSGGDLENEARSIIKRSLLAKKRKLKV